MDRFMLVSYGFAWTLAVLHGFMLVALLTQIGRLLHRVAGEGDVLITDDGPPMHRILVQSALAAPDAHLNSLSGGRERMILFLDPHCGPCHTLLRSLGRFVRAHQHRVGVLVAIECTREDIAKLARTYRLTNPCIADEGGALRRGLSIGRVPFGILLDRDGVVRMKGVVSTTRQLEGLLDRRGRGNGGLVWRVGQDNASKREHS